MDFNQKIYEAIDALGAKFHAVVKVMESANDIEYATLNRETEILHEAIEALVRVTKEVR